MKQSIIARVACQLLVGGLMVPAYVAAATEPLANESPAALRLQSSLIWTQAEPPPGQTYAAFRKTFELGEVPLSATLRIFADTRYVLWLNGQYVSRGPCRFDPKRPEYDVLDVAKHLRRGRNAIVVLGHYAAVGSFHAWNEQCARMMEHRPGLTAELEFSKSDGSMTHLKTDASWRCTTQTRYLPGPGSYTSVVDQVDARRDSGDWSGVDFDDSSWPAAVPLAANAWAPLHARSIPLLREVEVANLRLVEAQPVVVEPGPLTERLPLTLALGAQVVIDCGRAVQAYTVLDIDASDGSCLEVDHTAQFFDTKGPAKQSFGGGPNRYTARAGRQTYMSTDTFGCRFIVLKVTAGNITLHGLRAVDRLYPFDRLGRFTSSDEVLDRIWQTGVRTVEVCSEDAHVDCADRERAQWMADGYRMGYTVSRVTLAGPGENGRPYYADGRLLRNMLRHVAFSQLPDGRLQPMRPSEYPVSGTHGVIDDYSCLWVQAVADLYRHDGDPAFAREVWPVMVKTLDYFLKRRTDCGLIYANEFVYFANPLAYVSCEGATINSYIYGSLRDAAEVGRMVGDPPNATRFAAAADQLRDACNRELWDEQAGSYHGALVRSAPPVPADTPPSFAKPNPASTAANGLTPPTGHAALLTLRYGLVPADRQARVFAFVQKQLAAENPDPYTCAFYLETLYQQDTAEMDRAALKAIGERWTHMTRYETGTTSEGWHGGSFIHESGGHPAYFLSSYVLGVRTDGPREARRLLIDPRLGDLELAEGTTLTEFGPVTVRWQRDAKQTLSFDILNATTVPALLTLRLPAKEASLTLDNVEVLRQGTPAIAGVTVQNGRILLPLPSGKHAGRFE